MEDTLKSLAADLTMWEGRRNRVMASITDLEGSHSSSLIVENLPLRYTVEDGGLSVVVRHADGAMWPRRHDFSSIEETEKSLRLWVENSRNWVERIPALPLLSRVHNYILAQREEFCAAGLPQVYDRLNDLGW